MIFFNSAKKSSEAILFCIEKLFMHTNSSKADKNSLCTSIHPLKGTSFQTLSKIRKSATINLLLKRGYPLTKSKKFIHLPNFVNF